MQNEISQATLTNNTSTTNRKEIMVNGLRAELGSFSTKGTLF